MAELKAAGATGTTGRALARRLGHACPVAALKALARCHQLNRDCIKTEWRTVPNNQNLAQELIYRYTEPSEDLLK